MTQLARSDVRGVHQLRHSVKPVVQVLWVELVRLSKRCRDRTPWTPEIGPADQKRIAVEHRPDRERVLTAAFTDEVDQLTHDYS